MLFFCPLLLYVSIPNSIARNYNIFVSCVVILLERTARNKNRCTTVDHSRQAYTFAWWGVAIFVVYVVYRFFADSPGGWDGLNIFDW